MRKFLRALALGAGLSVMSAGAAFATTGGPADVAKVVKMHEVASETDTSALQHALTGGNERGNWFHRVTATLFGGHDDDVVDVDLLAKTLQDVETDADVRDNVIGKVKDVLNNADVANDADVNVLKDVVDANVKDNLNNNEVIVDALNGNDVEVEDVIAIGNTEQGDKIIVTK